MCGKDHLFRVETEAEAPPVPAGRPRGARLRMGRAGVRVGWDVLRFADVAGLVLTGLAAEQVYLRLNHYSFETDYARFTLGAAVLSPFALHLAGAYGDVRRPPDAESVRRAWAGGASLFAAALILGFVFKTSMTISRLWLAVWFVLFMLGLALSRAGLAAAMKAFSEASLLREGVAVVGATPLAAEVVDHLRRRSTHPVDVLGVFDDRRRAREGGGPEVEVAGSVDDLLRLGQQQAVSHVILALPWTAEARVEEMLHRLKALAVDITVCADPLALRLIGRTVDDLGGLPAFRLASRPLRPWTHLAKQLEDWLLGGALVLLLSPVLALTALAVKLDSPGPVLFRQRRHGYNNREFTVYKFRTMHADAGDSTGGRQTRRGDARVTRLGRWLRAASLDELPQLFNVLRGEMSLVGPRPHPVGMRTGDALGDEIVRTYSHRHRVKPGLTGWAQVHGLRGATESAEALTRRVEYDLDYIDRCSILLDLHILLLTPFRVISRKNAF